MVIPGIKKHKITINFVMDNFMFYPYNNNKVEVLQYYYKNIYKGDIINVLNSVHNYDYGTLIIKI